MNILFEDSSSIVIILTVVPLATLLPSVSEGGAHVVAGTVLFFVFVIFIEFSQRIVIAMTVLILVSELLSFPILKTYLTIFPVPLQPGKGWMYIV